MRRSTLSLLLALTLAAPANAQSTHITLLHTTDLHGALDGWDYLADQPAARGLTRIATLVKRARAEGSPVLLLDAGDAIQGGIEFAFVHRDPSLPEPMLGAMKRLSYDAMALGNHEFDRDLPALAAAAGADSIHWLSANLTRSGHGPTFWAPSCVRVAGGVRVGIVGLTTPATAAFEDPEALAGLHFGSMVDAARAEVARLRQSEHCDVIVLLAHTGMERDSAGAVTHIGDTPDENWGQRLARDVPGADVVILGHTHVVIPSLTLYGTLVTQAGRWGEGLGRIDLTLNRDGEHWKLATRSARVIAVNDSVPEDSAMAAYAAPFHVAARESLARVVATNAVPRLSPLGRAGPGSALQLVHDAQLAASGAEVSLATPPDPAYTLPAGPVRMRDLWRLSPYENTLDVLQLTGAQLISVLEQSAHAFSTYTAADAPMFDPAYPLYNFDVASGVTYRLDLTRPAGDRVRDLALGGKPLANERRLRVAINSYRANGGGGFAALVGALRLTRIARPVPELIAEYLAGAAGASTPGGASAPSAATGAGSRATEARSSAAAGTWGLSPGYASTPERPLIDRLVRQHVLALDDLSALDVSVPARESQARAWLAKAFARGAAPAKGAAARAATTALTESRAVDLCVAAHPLASRRAADLASYRRSLLTGLSPRESDRPITIAQFLGMVSNARFPTLRVLETTDFHGFVISNARERRTRRPIGGSVALVSWVQQLRSENPEGTVLIDGGDWFQGTMISNLQFGRPVVEQMNRLEYTAAAIGNHDFDWTADTLAERAHEMHFAALGANCIVRATGRLPRYARADTVVTRRGVRIGILGLCYRETPTVTLPQNVAHLKFEDDSATAARLVPKLRSVERAQVVIAVGHIPGETDSTQHLRSGDLLRLARGVSGVDAWFGGHSHNLVLDEVNQVPVIIAGAHAEAVGVCDLSFDALTNHVVEHHARIATVYADALPVDSVFAARVATWNDAVASIAATPVGRATHRLTRTGENTIGYLVSDAMRVEGHVDIALTNGGGLRADLAEGAITKGGIYEVMPFDNTLVTMEMTGAELRRVFEEGLRTGRVLQGSGLKLTYDPKRAEMQRVVSLALADGSPVLDDHGYKIAVNNFIATGGDGYTSFAHAKNLTDTHELLRDMIENYVRKQCANGGAIEYAAEKRITRVSAAE